MPHFSVTEIRISLLFEENAIFYPGTITAINSLLLVACSRRSDSGARAKNIFSVLQSPFNWRILIRIMKCPKPSCASPFFEFLQIQSTLGLRTPRYKRTPRYYGQELKSWGTRINENNSHYYGLSLLRTPNLGQV